MKSKLSRRLLSALLCLLLLPGAVLPAGCKKPEQPAESLIEAESKADGEAGRSPYDIHTEGQASYMADSYDRITLYAKGVEPLDLPEPVLVAAAGMTGILLGEAADLSDAKTFPVVDGTARIYNLKIHTTYYWRNADGSGDVQSFTTEGVAPRNLKVDGAVNFRDLGGWAVPNGYTKQGVLFRGGKLSADDTGAKLITAEGEEAFRALGIKTELDLRTTDDGEYGGLEVSVAEGVQYISFPLKSGGNIIVLNRDKLPGLFAILGNEENYPLLFHCSIGTDRTGMLAFLINGLLGVSEEDLYRDFLFSNFAEIGKMRAPSMVKTYIDTVKGSGDTLAEQIYNYLLNNGVAEADIQTVIRMMTE